MDFLGAFGGAVFDLDGTLADSMGLWDNLCRKWLEKKGIIAPPDMEREIADMTLTESAAYIFRRFGAAENSAAIIAQWETLALGQYRESLNLKSGAGELIRALARRGIKLAIATSSFPACCEAILARHGIRDFFSTLVYTCEIDESKSDPGFWRGVAERLSVLPEKCVVFEDTYAALEGVRAAGMTFAAIYDPSCRDWPALSAGADFAFTAPGEALKLLETMPVPLRRIT
jgi:HAD superfamily hydrolase (TIGR01509 family)